MLSPQQAPMLPRRQMNNMTTIMPPKDCNQGCDTDICHTNIITEHIYIFPIY
jgi:hypothetical protein